jgi:hypothetical protein
VTLHQHRKECAHTPNNTFLLEITRSHVKQPNVQCIASAPHLQQELLCAPCTRIYFFTVFGILNSANRSGVSYTPAGLELSLETRPGGLGAFFWPVGIGAGLTDDDLCWSDAAAGGGGDAAKEPGVDVLIGRPGLEEMLGGLACLAALFNPGRGGCFCQAVRLRRIMSY